MSVCNKCVGTVLRKGSEMLGTNPRFFLVGTYPYGKIDKGVGEMGHYNVGNMERKK